MLDRIQDFLRLILSIGIGWWSQMRFPDAPEWVPLSLAALSLAAIMAIQYRAKLAALMWPAFKMPVLRIYIPLAEAVDMVWVVAKNARGLPPSFAEDPFSRITHIMFGGREDDVRLYGRRPNFRTVERIKNALEYEFSKDGTASNPWDGQRMVDLHVRRADVKRWMKIRFPKDDDADG